MSNVVEIDPKQRARRSLAYFLEACTIEERMRLLKNLEDRCFHEGYMAAMHRANQILDETGVQK